MTEPEQINHLGNELHALLRRFKNEYNMTVASAIGCMEVVKMELFLEQRDASDDEPRDPLWKGPAPSSNS